jgi:CheY-like chemotaxis protein
MAIDNHPDIIVLDLLLPNGDGEAVLRELRTREETKDIPVVILTNLTDEELKQRCVALGCVEYLVKADFGLDQVVQKVKELYERCASERR